MNYSAFQPILALDIMIFFFKLAKLLGGGGGNDMFAPPPIFSWGGGGRLPPRIDASESEALVLPPPFTRTFLFDFTAIF